MCGPPGNQMRILEACLLSQATLTPVRCVTAPSTGRSCAALYPSRRRLCASRRCLSDALVIRRKTPLRRQRVLSTSPAQWSPGSSQGLWCKSFFILQKKPAPVTNLSEINCGSRLLRPFETMRAPEAIGFRISQCVKESRYGFLIFDWKQTKFLWIVLCRVACARPGHPLLWPGCRCSVTHSLCVILKIRTYDKHKKHDVMLWFIYPQSKKKW